MSDLKHYLRPFWGYIILTMLIKLAGALLELMIPYLMEVMLDVKVPAGDLTGIYICGGLMLIHPSLITDLCGLALVIGGLAFQYMLGRKK